MADISGTWLGAYWQHSVQTRFEATLVQGGNAFSGNILDDSHLGEAQVSGEIIGRRIQFTKRYLNLAQTPVTYTGTLDETGDRMQGTWRIGLFDSGPWEAHRNSEASSEDLMTDLRKRLVEQVPAGVSR